MLSVKWEPLEGNGRETSRPELAQGLGDLDDSPLALRASEGMGAGGGTNTGLTLEKAVGPQQAPAGSQAFSWSCRFGS